VAGVLPFLLAGPILRRVEPRQCVVWVALSEPADQVHVRIWAGAQAAGDAGGTVRSGEEPAGEAFAKPRRFGAKLYIAVVDLRLVAPSPDLPTGARTDPPLTPNTLYAYDVWFTGVPSGDKSLASLGLLRDEPEPAGWDHVTPLGLALGYAADQLPTFVAPPAEAETLRLAHGSCRKTRGTSSYDALAYLDDRIKDTWADTDRRPHLLMLTGDQIYADDLSANLLYMLGELAEELVGTERIDVGTQPLEVNGETTDVPIGILEINRRTLPPARRKHFIQTAAGFTTSDYGNHLVSFGEYAAMYLAVWNHRVWRELGTAETICVEPPGGALPSEKWPLMGRPELDEPYKDEPDPLAAWLEAVKKAETEPAGNITRTLRFRATLPRVARALANVATYMIFDDHDVTDDWNLNKKWCNRVYPTEPGMAIVRNALMAYALFQGWGNDPQAFESGNNKEFLKETERLFSGDGPYPTGSTEAMTKLAGGSGSGPAVQAVWHYRTSGSGYVIAVMDSRTRRKFTGQQRRPPDLIGLNRDEQIPAGPLTDGRKMLIVVSPAPVFGPEVIESLGWSIAQHVIDLKQKGKGLDESGRPRFEVGAERYDAEGWASNDEAREALFKRLATHRWVVLLSGDVHYACSLTLDYWKKDPATPPSRIVQLTSSSLHNVFKDLAQTLTRNVALLQGHAKGAGAERVAWDDKAPIKVPPDSIVSPGRLARAFRSPALLNAQGWPAGTTVERAPDWSWRIQLVEDERPETALPSQLRQPFLAAGEELDPADPLKSYRAVAARHQAATVTRFDQLRRIVFAPNIGLVSFSRQGDEWTLTHTLLSQNARESPAGAEGTVHVIPLTTPAADKAPTISEALHA
jgi:hypothetical protein